MPSYQADEPSYQANKPVEHQRINAVRAFELSATDRECIGQLVGHTLAMVEREFILQTLRRLHGNRTRAADLLRISIRSLRDRIRCYRHQGESVPEPGSVDASYQTARQTEDARH